MLAAEDSHEAEDRLENLAELVAAAAEYDAREEAPSLAGFLDGVSLLSDIDQARDDAPVIMMTLHSAKGLEFESVFLVGLEEGLLPHSRSLAADEAQEALEEERRLCYVGMTRAMESLCLTCAASRMVFGQRRHSTPSRFLAEIPKEGLVITGAERRMPPAVEIPRGRPAQAGAASSPGCGPGELRPGARVRHPLFGVGTVLRSDGSGDDLKVTVSFTGIGPKRLVARYAGLEPA
jgi:DNA helicase-2/ATP-dependent DNA helicase PcrA